VTLRVCQALKDRLQTAEAALVNDATVNPKKLDAPTLGAELKMYASTSDMREPKAAVGGTSLSMHSFGLAVDLNYEGNPFLGFPSSTPSPEIVGRATSQGAEIDKQRKAHTANT
jgi:hypothetical protein